ncbi:MAG: helix-turn-helix domain-containing protein, partial [Egibacteraceae bacterium]
MTGSGSWGAQWSADEVAQLRSALGLNKLSFADRLRVHRRTVSRWEEGDTAPTDHRIIEALDDLLCETVGELSPLLSPIQVRQMHRRDALRLLATGVGAAAPAGGAGGLWSDGLRRVDDRTLDHLEAVSAGLVGMYATSSPGVLGGPVAAHLEDATRLLVLAMSPPRRQRLQAGIAEIALLVGNLAHSAHRPAQASGHFQFAERHAREAEDQALLAAALTAQSGLLSTTISGGRSPSPEALVLLVQADALASRHAPAITQAWTAARLAEEQACAHDDANGGAEAFDRAQRALERARLEALPVSCSTAQYHALLTDEGLDGFRGICDILLGRPERAADALTSALAHVSWPRRQAIIL